MKAAFPIIMDGGIHERGMDLRDYFAAKAMQGILSKYGMGVPDFEYADEPGCDAEISRWAYSIADEMMIARER